MTNRRWMLYGATGFTGRLVAEEAVRRGSRPIVAGRDAEKTRLFAEALGLEWVAFSIEDKDAVLKAAASVDLVLNAAGPFMQTCAPMMDACLTGKTHYLDISNEISVFQAARDRHRLAEGGKVSIIPGVGFGTVASNCLVRHVCEQIKDPVALEIALVPYVAQTSAGAAKSTLEVIGQGGRVRRGGKLVNVPLGSGAKRICFADGERDMMPVPSGDLEAAYLATGIADITVYAPAPLSPGVARLALPIVQRLLSQDWLREKIGRKLERRGVAAKKALPPGDQRSRLWARVTDRAGNAAEAWLQTGEGYTFTAAASVLAVEWVLDARPAGVLTPASFGPDFVLKAGGVWCMRE